MGEWDTRTAPSVAVANRTIKRRRTPVRLSGTLVVGADAERYCEQLVELSEGGAFAVAIRLTANAQLSAFVQALVVMPPGARSRAATSVRDLTVMLG